MVFFKHMILNLVLFLAFDFVWLKFFAGKFFAGQLKEIGRFADNGDFNVRLIPAILVYVLMSLAMELFVFKNQSVISLKDHLLYGFILGLCLYGVFDLTNRAMIDHYPYPMVVVDMMWGTLLFTTVTYINFELRRRLTFI